MFVRQLLHYFHGELVVVYSYVGCLINRSKLVLCRSHLIVFGFGGNAQFPQFFIQIMHISGYSRFQSTEIVILHFLTLGRLCTKQGSSGKNEIFSLLVQLFIYQEVFLLRTNGGVYTGNLSISQQVKYPGGFPA